MKKNLLFSLLLVFSNGLVAQTQIGSNFIGAVLGEDTGRSVSVSSTILGDIVAIGTPYNDQSTTMGGYVKVYQLSGSVWNQKGQTINAEANSDYFGEVKLSGNGTRLVIGAKFNDGNGTSSGHVRVFSFDSGTSTWVQLGADINGEAAGDEFGTTVAISHTGSVIAVGAPKNNNGASSNSGHVRVYSFDSGTSSWIQRGADINGNAANDQFGESIALSPDGSKLIAASKWGNSSDGYVEVYTWNGTAWIQKGTTISDGGSDKSGTGVAISSDGNRIVVGAPNSGAMTQGNVKVYSYSGSAWAQLGSTITGWINGMNLGSSVSMSDSGNEILVGAPKYTVSLAFRGAMIYYKYNGSAWVSVGTVVTGSSENEELGTSVAMSSDGNKVVVGAPISNNTTGHARVYDYTSALSLNDFQLNNKFSIYPNPISNQFQLNTDITIDKVEVLNLQGQVVKTFENQESYNINDLTAGIYVVMIHSEEGKGIKKIIKN